MLKKSFAVVQIAALMCVSFAVALPNVAVKTGAVSISGQVKTPNGRGIKGARVVIKDAKTMEVVSSVMSSTFGHYKLEGIETGRMYVLSVSHKSFLFALPSHLLEVEAERTGMDFVGEPAE